MVGYFSVVVMDRKAIKIGPSELSRFVTLF